MHTISTITTLDAKAVDVLYALDMKHSIINCIDEYLHDANEIPLER